MFIVVIGNATEQIALDTIIINLGMFVLYNVNMSQAASIVWDIRQLKLIQMDKHNYDKEDLFGGRYVWKKRTRKCMSGELMLNTF